MKIVDAHSHLWLKQNTTWNGLPIKSRKNGRSIFLGEEVQMLPPFIIDGKNTAEVFLSNMDYAQVSAAVVVQELIDGCQNRYLQQVGEKYPNRFITCGMVNFFQPNLPLQGQILIDSGFKGLAIPGHRLLTDELRIQLNSQEMIKLFKQMEERDAFLSITLADGKQQTEELRDVIRTCPKLRIAIGHLCMANPPATPCWENEDWKRQVMLARYDNVFIETGGITWLYNSEFYPYPSAVRAIKEAAGLVGFDKLMWGSDYPRTITAITYLMSYDFILKTPELRDEEKTLFLGENAARFYQLQDLVDLPYIKNMSE